MAEPAAFRADLRAVLPIAALAVVVFVIILVELCGREDVPPLAESAVRPTVPLGPTFTPAPGTTIEGPTAAGTPVIDEGAAERDLLRAADLQAVQDAMEAFFAEEDEYPDTGGNVQTLCAFEDSDAGCEIDEFLDPIPSDPLGSPTENGYWYRSDGEVFIVFGQRESEALPECGEHPAHLDSFASVFCLRGP